MPTSRLHDDAPPPEKTGPGKAIRGSIPTEHTLAPCRKCSVSETSSSCRVLFHEFETPGD